MKITKIHKYKHKLLELKLIKTKIYKKNHSNFIKISDTINRLRKAMHVIYKFHTNHKRIMFVGSPINLNDKLNKIINNTNHISIPETVWMDGIITNQMSCFKYLSINQKTINSKISDILFKTKKKCDLIVILNAYNNKNALIEGYISKTPTIVLNIDLDTKDFRSSYKIPGNFKFTNKKIRNNIFYSILRATLKKANIKNPKNKRINKKTHNK